MMNGQMILSGFLGALFAGTVFLIESAVRRRAAKRAVALRAAARRTARRADGERTDSESPQGRKKIDTSKKLAAWCAVAASVSMVMPFILSLMDKQPVSDVTHTVFPACIGYLITYAGKSLGEKLSRNKHGLDENGFPYDTEV